MTKKTIALTLFALATYIVFVMLVVFFYNDSPDQMKWSDREQYNRQFIAKVKPNQFTFEQALEELGSPDITEAININNMQFQVLFYRTQHIKSDGITTQNECSFLLFVNSTLREIGLGENYPDNWQIIKRY